MTPGYFVELLSMAPKSPNVFNPWADVDPDNDKSEGSPLLRKKNLTDFLESRKESARVIIFGEALGYQGGHFSGIAMTSERILLGNHKEIPPHAIIPNTVFERTSSAHIKPTGFNEPTASVVWSEAISAGLASQIVTWNAFPWHPYSAPYLTNRTPTREELLRGKMFISYLKEMFPRCIFLAMGNKSAGILTDMGFKYTAVRHPAYGGAADYRKQFRAAMGL